MSVPMGKSNNTWFLKAINFHDSVEAYDGVHGLFRHNHKRSDAETYIKVGYHEGIVDAETWLAVQDKKSHNRKVPSNGTAKSSWLTGITKCGNCGYSIATRNCLSRKKDKMWRYYIDKGYYMSNSCDEQFLKIRPDEAEQVIFEAMKQRLESLVIAKTEKVKPDTETENIKVEIIRLDDEIRKLMEKLADADSVLFDYIQERVKTLHAQKSEFDERLRAKIRKHKEIDTSPLEDPLSRWDELAINEKHAIAKTMLEVVYLSDENGIDIRFAIWPLAPSKGGALKSVVPVYDPAFQGTVLLGFCQEELFLDREKAHKLRLNYRLYLWTFDLEYGSVGFLGSFYGVIPIKHPY